MPYSTGSWDADSLGNHRVVLRVDVRSDVVSARIPWRRRDYHPEQKKFILVDATTGREIQNIVAASTDREVGEIVFQPLSVPGQYHLYYLPYVGSKKSNYPKIAYPRPEQKADTGWVRRNHLMPSDLRAGGWRLLPKAKVVEFQSIDEFNSFYPMEVIATRSELAALSSAHPHASYLVFPEDRRFPIRMTSDLPMRWMQAAPEKSLRGRALRGEFYVFQLGLYALRNALHSVQLSWGDLKEAGKGRVISSRAFRCINLGGIDCAGNTFRTDVHIDSGMVQALWCGVQIPETAAPGEYAGSVVISAANAESSKVNLVISVSDSLIVTSGDNEPWRLSRLRWLDSRLAFNDEVVTLYRPLTVQKNRIQLLGRTIVVGGDGLPEQVTSYFTPEMTSVGVAGRDLLVSPMRLHVEGGGGKVVTFQQAPVKFVHQTPGRVVWETEAKSPALSLVLHAELEFDGCLEYTIALRGLQTIALDDVRLEIPLRSEVARYAMGLGLKGGIRPDTFQWKWNVTRNQDGAWIGDVNAGLQFTLKDEKYSRPLNTNFYQLKPLVMPASWHNEGKGEIRFDETGAECYRIRCSSGARILHAGEMRHFNVRLLLTPFRPIDIEKQWSTRFYHRYKPVKEIAVTGANAINVHHATEINPYINYPFLRPSEMKAYADEAHANGMKMKIYYTVRELTNRAPELFALRSLGHEIFSPGAGGGFSWLQEHLGGDYIAAWFVPELKDAAIINSGVSRWHNFYVEGMNWLVKNVGIDGLYIDDVAFDRLTMKRIRRVLDSGRSGGLIDLHSANQYNERDGFANSANLYLEHFPYIDRLWFGEYFDYDAGPDFWLVEMSGIPFGLMGEMLEKGGNPWRGAVFGMTNRLPWAGDPRPIWKVWDEFGIKGSHMIGYWVSSAPVKTGNDSILATTYVREGKALIALASWAKELCRIRLTFDWKRLGIDGTKARLRAPAVENFQPAMEFGVNDAIPVAPGRGWLLVVEGKRGGPAR